MILFSLAGLSEENEFRGFVEGQGFVVTGHDTEYPVGKVGLFARALEPAYFFEGLNVEFVGPASPEDWDWPE